MDAEGKPLREEELLVAKEVQQAPPSALSRGSGDWQPRTSQLAMSTQIAGRDSVADNFAANQKGISGA